MAARKRPLTCYVTDDVYRRVKEIARMSGRSVSSVIATILAMYLSAPPGASVTMREVREIREVTVTLPQKREPVALGRGYGDAKTHAEIMAELKEVLKRRRQKM